MACFDEAIEFVLRNEDSQLSGAVTEDAGGRTRFGIAERFHPELGDEFYCGDRDRALEIARGIYREEYWRVIQGDRIADQRVAAKLLDMAVNIGVRQAVVLCQRAVNAVGWRIEVDGCLGEKTLAAVNGVDPARLLRGLGDCCEAFYRHVVGVKPEDEKYLKGWLVRAKLLPALDKVDLVDRVDGVDQEEAHA